MRTAESASTRGFVLLRVHVHPTSPRYLHEPPSMSPPEACITLAAAHMTGYREARWPGISNPFDVRKAIGRSKITDLLCILQGQGPIFDCPWHMDASPPRTLGQ